MSTTRYKIRLWEYDGKASAANAVTFDSFEEAEARFNDLRVSEEMPCVEFIKERIANGCIIGDEVLNVRQFTSVFDAIAVIHNQPPVISGSNADLGTKRGDFTYQYSVTDPDGDTVNVVEKIDGKTIATKNAITLGATQTLSVSGNTFTALTNAKHTITITATDSAGNSAVRTLTFTKSIAGFVITLSAPLEANSQPTRANIKVTRDIPAGGTFKVEATNNPFDASPVWEDCTNAVVQGVAHVFTNKINTAAQYGMNIRVTVQRGDALTACWVSGIGGNFE